MRTIVPRRSCIRTLASALSLSALALHPGTSPAQDNNDPNNGLPPILPPPGFESVHLEVDNITAPGAELHKLVVTYHASTPIDIPSIDDRDIWVASRNGYNALAGLLEVVELPVPLAGDPAGAPVVIDDGGIAPFPFHGVQATYAIKPGTGDSWSEEDNGRYVVLLQPGQVRKRDGSAFAADLLGDFHVRVGDPVPALPVDASVSIRRELATTAAGEPVVIYFADLRVTYIGDDVEVTSWGEVERDGNRFSVEIEAYRPPGSIDPGPGPIPLPAGGAFEEGDPDRPVIVRTFEHSYRLGRLDPGEYKFGASSFGEPIAGESWVIPPDVEPVPAFPVQTSINVHQLPQIAIFPPPPPEYGAEVKLFFQPGGVEIVSWGEVKREGDTFTAEVLAVRRPDITPGDPVAGADGSLGQTFRYEYPLGNPGPGEYKFVLTSRGRVLGTEEFRVPDPDPDRPPARVHMDVQWITSHSATIRAYVEFLKPGWRMTEFGEPERVDDFTFVIDSKAERNLDNLSSTERATAKRYHLSPLGPGEYKVIYRINGFEFDDVKFEIIGGGQRPHIYDIKIHEGDASHAAEVFVVLPHPGIGILSWGNARREGNAFFAEIVVGPLPQPDPRLLNHPQPDGVPDDFPGFIVSNFYNLGVLDPGAYAFHVTYEGEPIFTEEFKVRHVGDSEPPEVEVDVENIEEPKGEPHRFVVRYSDASGLDLESIRGAKMVVLNRRLGYEVEAELLEFASTDDVPPSGASAVYAVEAPGGSWDALDRGRYSILTDPEAIRDLQGNHIDGRRIGGFKVDIWPDPPGFPREAEIDVAQDPATGLWNADVSIELPEELAAPDDWEIDWGEVHHYGHVLVAVARYRKVGEAPADDPAAGFPRTPRGDGGNTQTVSHQYELGALRDGRYLFVFLSNLGHFGKERFTAGLPDGGGGDPIDEILPFEAWQAAAFEPGDWALEPQLVEASSNPDLDPWSNFEEYAFGFDPLRPDAADPPVSAELVEDGDGVKHLGVRYHEMLAAEDVEYRVLGSADLREWTDITDGVDLVHREAGADGKVDVLACVREALGDSPWRYLKVLARPAPID